MNDDVLTTRVNELDRRVTEHDRAGRERDQLVGATRERILTMEIGVKGMRDDINGLGQRFENVAASQNARIESGERRREEELERRKRNVTWLAGVVSAGVVVATLLVDRL